jgi:hypothetical protein
MRYSAGFLLILFVLSGICSIATQISASSPLMPQISVDQSGTTYYISYSMGNDSNDGLSPETAWRSFSHLNIIRNRYNFNPVIRENGDPYLDWEGNPAVSWLESYEWGSVQLLPGDTIALKAGDEWNEPLHLMGEGNQSTPITLTSYGEGTNPLISLNGHENDTCVQIEGASHWVIENLDLRRAKLGLYLHYWDDYNNYDVTIRNCNFADISSSLWDMHGLAGYF